MRGDGALPAMVADEVRYRLADGKLVRDIFIELHNVSG